MKLKIQRANRSYMTASQMKHLWDTYSEKYSESRKRIHQCRALRENKKMFSLPPEFNVPGAENLIITMPQKITIPLKTLNVLGKKQPKLKRFAIGKTPTASLLADNVETWVNGAIEKRIKWGDLIGKLFLDGECAVIVLPSLAHWQHAPDFMDSLSADEFSNLDEETQERYRMLNDEGNAIDLTDEDEEIPASTKFVKVNKQGTPVPNERYWRDSQDRTPDDSYYSDPLKKRKFKENRKKTLSAFEEDQKHWLAEKLPFLINVISATECAPVFGVDGDLEGLIVCRQFSRESLFSRKYAWDDDGDMLTQDDMGDVSLYEYWGVDSDGTPYVAYSVNGMDTYFRDDEDEVDAIIDLRQEFGIRNLPVKYCWGLHFETDDYKNKGVPFLWPVLGSITGVEALATTVLVHSYNTAFGAWGVAADPQIVRDNPGILLDGTAPRTFPFSPLTTTILPGRPYPLVHPGVGKDVKDLLQMLVQAAASMAPSDIVFGSGNATSGHDRSVSRAYLEDSMSQVLDGALDAYEFIGEKILEICCNITKVTGVQVPVYDTVLNGQLLGKGPLTDNQRRILVLKPEWVGPVYALKAFYPESAGDNMMLVQQLAQLLLQGLVTFREFREKAFGDQNPIATLLEIFADQALKLDSGRAEIAQLAAEMTGAAADEEKQKLVENMRLTQGGTPMAALPPEIQALNTGKIPEGVDPQLFLIKLRGMLAHDAARAALNPTGPLGGNTPPTAPLAPNVAVPPAMTPPGAPGPASNGPQGVNEQAPTLSGMSLPNAPAQALGGSVSGARETPSIHRDNAARG